MTKSDFNFKIIYPDGKTIDMDEKNYWVNSFRVQPIEFSRTTQSVDGRKGLIESKTEIGARKIDVTIQIEAYDVNDFDFLKDEIQAIFNPFAEFYIVRDLQPGKRYKVKVDKLNGIDYTEGSLEDGEFSVTFVMYMPFVESIGTSLQLQNIKESDVDLWQWSQGIDGDRVYRYEHQTNNFVINNFGDIEIDPCETELEITVKATASSFLQIHNKTTGDTFRLNRSIAAADTLKLSGIRTYINGISAFKYTNHELLSLAIGDNEFEVTGGTIRSIAFNFRSLYY